MARQFDFIVIGAGSGGIASANRAALHGAKVAIIEANHLGGTCVNVGCVPKKVMWNAAHIRDAIHYSEAYGFDVQLNGFDWLRLVNNRRAYIERIHASYARSFANNQVTYIQGFARFIAANTLEVNGEQISAAHIAIATGGRPAKATIPGAGYGIDSDGFFALQALPKKAVVVGGGYIAVELAGVLHSLGCQTHWLWRGDRPLKHIDKDIVDALLARQPVELVRHSNTQPERIEKTAAGLLNIYTSGGQLLADVDCLIWAIGRTPASDQLNLQAAGIHVDKQGFIRTDAWHNTSVKGIYALGDVTGQTQLTPVAVKAGRLLAERLFAAHKPPQPLDDSLVPTVIFSHPPIGSIGLSEQQAEQHYGSANIKVYRSSFAAMYNAITPYRALSSIKLVCQGPDEKIVGLHGVGEGMDELLQGFAVAITMGARKADFDATLAIHPTSAEEFVTLR